MTQRTLRRLNGEPYQLTRPNPLVNPGGSTMWNPRSLTYQNWDSFAPAVRGYEEASAPAVELTLQDYLCVDQGPQNPTAPPPPPPDVLRLAPSLAQPPSAPPLLPSITAAEESPNEILESGDACMVYVLEGSYDALYGESRGRLRERGVLVYPKEAIDDWIALSKSDVMNAGVARITPGSVIVHQRTRRRFDITDCVEHGDKILIQVDGASASTHSSRPR